MATTELNTYVHPLSHHAALPILAVQDGGKAAFDLAEKHLRASDDAVVRREMLGAMGSVTDPALAARARGFVLEPGLLRLNEIFSVIFGQAGEEELRRSEEHTSELQSLMRISYAVFCLKKK